jgi:hypothetical protein
MNIEHRITNSKQCFKHNKNNNLPARIGTRPRQNKFVGLANGEAGRAGGQNNDNILVTLAL